MQNQLCDLSQKRVSTEPFPHVMADEFIQREHYAHLRQSFPECPPKVGPTGYSLYWGDDDYEKLLNTDASWRRLFETFHSQSFIDWCSTQFAEVWTTEGCGIDLSKALYVHYREDRIDKERPSLRKIMHEPDELWVRMDIHQGQPGYSRPIHVDHARRLLSMLIYFCDQDENEMTGGELYLHENKNHPRPTSVVSPRHNRMIAFPCTSRSHHSVPRITAQKAPRNYVQVHISSSVDIWPRPVVPVWKRTFGKVKQSVRQVIRPVN